MVTDPGDRDSGSIVIITMVRIPDPVAGSSMRSLYLGRSGSQLLRLMRV
ncbi:hypothetical protein FDG2_1187 [Candidatus Protofrankia californiensis]|uniref:Uncharacterized protein n=1 Tax=Candidatus Protofrankia californiensis TaxID=1839754 RepID=A0A1C3NV66_9ACTN|nr:hypothetical protein FDG2_1187 [Candidatus Protofrankia californiensis]